MALAPGGLDDHPHAHASRAPLLARLGGCGGCGSWLRVEATARTEAGQHHSASAHRLHPVPPGDLCPAGHGTRTALV